MASRTGSFTSRPNDISPTKGRYRTRNAEFEENLIGANMPGGSVGVHFEYIDELITFAGSATYDTTALIPQGAIVYPGWAYVATTLAGASVSTYIVGIAGATNKFLATGTAITAGTKTLMAAHWAGTVAIVHTAAAAAVRVTPDTSATSGVLRLVIPYINISTPA